MQRTSRIRFVLLLSLVLAVLCVAPAGAVQGQPVGMSRHDLEVFFAFVDNHAWLTSMGMSAEDNVYSLSKAEFGKLHGLLQSTLAELKALRAQADNYRSKGRGRDYDAARTDILQRGFAHLQAQLSPAAWARVTDYIARNLHVTVNSAKLTSGSGRAARGGYRPSDYGAEDVYFCAAEEIVYFQNGIVGKSSSWAAGDDALNWSPTVSGAKGLKNGVTFWTWQPVTASPGDVAWAGWPVTALEPATFKQESFHSYRRNTGETAPPFSYMGYFPEPMYCQLDGYCNVIQAFSATLSIAANQEAGKPAHFLALTNCSGGSVTITATITPPGAPSAAIAWTGGSPGSDYLHRQVNCSSAGDTDVDVRMTGVSAASARIHIIDATSPPPAAEDAPKNHSYGGMVTCNIAPDFGRVVFGPGPCGGEWPTYDISPYFDTDRWYFRLASVSHHYRIGTNANGRVDLPTGEESPFPIAPGLDPGNIPAARDVARADFNTAGLVPAGGGVGGPPLTKYWVHAIVDAHEDYHVTDFYSNYWPDGMGLFESEDVESANVYVVFDCNDTGTTTGAGAVLKKKGGTLGWDARIEQRQAQAFNDWTPACEANAHGFSNPLYLPIRSHISTIGAPYIGAIVPQSGRRGTEDWIEVYGSNLDFNSWVDFTGYGVEVLDTWVSASQVNVQYRIESDADVGPHTLLVVTDSGTATATFTVTAPPPTISGLLPDNAVQGASGYIGIYGMNLANYPQVTISGNGVTLYAPFWIDDLLIDVPFTIAANADPGPHTLTVTTNSGNASATFTVFSTPQPPTIAGIIPAQGARGTNGYIEIYGSNLSPSPVVNISGGGVSVTNVYVSASQVNVYYVIDPNATPGTRYLTVTTAVGTSNGVTFVVQ